MKLSLFLLASTMQIRGTKYFYSNATALYNPDLRNALDMSCSWLGGNASLPLEVEGLHHEVSFLSDNEDQHHMKTHCCKSSVDGVGGKVPLSLGVARVADANVAVDVQDSALSTRCLHGRDEVEAVAPGVFLSVDRTHKVGT